MYYCTELCYLLYLLFRRVCRAGEFPLSWKVSCIILATNVEALSQTHNFIALLLFSLRWPQYLSELFTHNYIGTFPLTFYPLSLGLLKTPELKTVELLWHLLLYRL